MTVMFHLWRKAAQERNSLEMVRRQLVHDLAVTRAELATVMKEWDGALADLEQTAALLAVTECERDDALLRVDAFEQTVEWLEKKMGVGR